MLFLLFVLSLLPRPRPRPYRGGEYRFPTSSAFLQKNRSNYLVFRILFAIFAPKSPAGTAYDLGGRKAKANRKGVVIIDGKLVLKK